jgi:hypothetical protein
MSRGSKLVKMAQVCAVRFFAHAWFVALAALFGMDNAILISIFTAIQHWIYIHQAHKDTSIYLPIAISVHV